jgi:hypothetical protein
MNPTYAWLICITLHIFVHSYMFRRNYAIFKESLHQYLKLTKGYVTVGDTYCTRIVVISAAVYKNMRLSRKVWLKFYMLWCVVVVFVIVYKHLILFLF